MGFPALSYRQPDGVCVVFPDLPGCVRVGRLALMEKDGDVLPAPTMPVDAAEGCRADLIGKVWIQLANGISRSPAVET